MAEVAGAIGSAVIGGIASNSAAKKQAKSQKQAMALQKQQYDANVARAQPFLESGQNSLKLYQDAIGANGPEAQAAYYAGFQNDPGWEASQAAGVRAIERGGSRSGMYGSGNTLAGLYNYGQQNMLGAFQNRLGNLNTGAGYGIQGLNSITGSSNNFTNQQTNGFNNIGAAQAGGIVGMGQAANSGIQNYLDYMKNNQGAAAGAQTGYRTGNNGMVVGGV